MSYSKHLKEHKMMRYPDVDADGNLLAQVVPRNGTVAELDAAANGGYGEIAIATDLQDSPLTYNAQGELVRFSRLQVVDRIGSNGGISTSGAITYDPANADATTTPIQLVSGSSQGGFINGAVIAVNGKLPSSFAPSISFHGALEFPGLVSGDNFEAAIFFGFRTTSAGAWIFPYPAIASGNITGGGTFAPRLAFSYQATALSPTWEFCIGVRHTKASAQDVTFVGLCAVHLE